MKMADTPNYLLLKEVVDHPELHLFIYDNSPLPQEDALFYNKMLLIDIILIIQGLATAIMKRLLLVKRINVNYCCSLTKTQKCQLLILIR